jgi:co-chaperonin GroES (HSP10)
MPSDERVTPKNLFVHPTAGRIIVQEDEALSQVGMIIIPDKVKKRPTTGVILEVGAGVVDFEVGQKICYGLYSGTVLTFKGWDPKTRINFRLLNVDEILAYVDQQAPELEGVGV